MDTMRERVLSRLAIFAEGKPADETADAIMAIVAEDREKLVEALEQAAYLSGPACPCCGAGDGEVCSPECLYDAALSSVGK